MTEIPNKNEDEIRVILSIKSITGILITVMGISAILLLISLLCPFCKYNPTVLDAFERSVSFKDLSFMAFLSFILFAGSAALLFPILFSKHSLRTQMKKFTLYFTMQMLFLFLSLVFMAIAIVFYEIPEEGLGMLELELSAGAIIYFIAWAVYTVSDIFFYLVLKVFVTKNLPIHRLIIVGSSKKVPTLTGNGDKSLEVKMLELKNLRDKGIITEQEYMSKKEELLKEYH